MLLLQSRLYSKVCTGLWNTDASLSSLSLGGILEGYSDAFQVAPKEEQKLD